MTAVVGFGPRHYEALEAKTFVSVTLVALDGTTPVTTYDATGAAPTPIMVDVRSGYLAFFAAPGTYELHFILSDHTSPIVTKVSLAAAPATSAPVSTLQQAAINTAASAAQAAAISAAATDAASRVASEASARNTAITNAINGLLNGAPGALDTLKELADAINDDASFAASVTTALAGKQPLDADLTAIAALTTTPFGRSLLTMVDAAATKTALSLGNVDNTADTAKPVSTAQAAANAAIQSAAASDATAKVAAQHTADNAAYVPKPGSGDAVGSVPTKQSDGSVLYAVPASGGASSLPTVDTLTYPQASAHRGCSNVFPENTIESVEGSIALGAQITEFSMFRLSDGGSMLMHDATVVRTTSGTGNTASFTQAGARLLTVDASNWFSANWPNLKVLSLDEVLDRINNAPIVSIVTSKSTGVGAMNQIINAATQRGMKRRIIPSSTLLSDMSLVSAAGMPGLYQSTNGTETTPAAVVARGTWAISFDFQVLNLAGTLASTIAPYKAAGLKIVVYNVQRQAHYDAAVAAGADIVNSDDSFYVSRNYTRYRQTVAPWTVDGTFTHGQQGSGYLSGDSEPSNGGHPRGDITGSPGNWWWNIGLLTGYILTGPFNPLANPNAYTLTVPISWDGAMPTASAFMAVLFGNPDENNTNTVSGALQSGMHARMHSDGKLDLSTCPAGGGAGVVRGTIQTTALQVLTLTAGLTSGVAVTSLPVNALTVALKVGHQFKLPTGQIATVSTAGVIGDTAVAVTSVTPNAAVASGASLFPITTVKIVVTATTITVSRADEPSITALTWTESTWRGPYVMTRQNSTCPMSLGAMTVT